jgi:hypothetical protein
LVVATFALSFPPPAMAHAFTAQSPGRNWKSLRDAATCRRSERPRELVEPVTNFLRAGHSLRAT